jgi:hypothetical protein
MRELQTVLFLPLFSGSTNSHYRGLAFVLMASSATASTGLPIFLPDFIFHDHIRVGSLLYPLSLLSSRIFALGIKKCSGKIRQNSYHEDLL